ncbi:5-formyltetrahydrofolate cyclo-ligase [Clostridium vincentii]|uniref:5-formyltetrahydrofolate cyclo-ligase n=1 Tax=Clostridium vincentii TaxID=52704 RepID=A0A2T0BFP5_9CLOT|nr:5-formyltetrahydrofolate cyclo-ligase [Clostridium vincentii]PRR82694.1 putative 5-formyltetrahydrofolate cyclo-ligase [Clostridium vincentii]
MKNKIRKDIIGKRDSLDLEKKRNFDKIIIGKLKETEEYKKSKNIFIYIGFGSEIDTAKYIEEFLMEGKKVFVPRTNMVIKTMDAVEITSLKELERNKFGILEPNKNKESIDKNQLQLIIMPGVAFDIDKGRIGYGGGYYDKYMEYIAEGIPKIALAYELQIIDKVPREDHDILPDSIITEKRTIIQPVLE